MPDENRIRSAWIAFALLAITVAAYSAVGSFDFINFDDPQYVYGNPQVTQGLTWSGVQWAFTTGHASNWHPLTWISHMVDVELFGVKPGPHHLVNLLLHVVNTLLLFGLLRRTTGATGRSALVAALFALHPLHVESVVWISERKDLLSTLFFMLTLWAYAAYARKPTLRRYLPVFVLLALGLLAKPMLVTLPFVLLLFDIWPLKRIGVDAWDRAMAARLVVEKIPLFALVAASSVVTFIVQREGGSVLGLDALPLDQRLPNALLSYIAYIGNMVWPSNLAILYPFPDSIPLWQSAGALVLLLAATVAAVLAIRRYPYLTVGWFWYLGMLVPVIGIVQVGTQGMADRYTYVPLIGLFLIIAWGGYDLLGRNSARRAPLAALCVLIIATLAIATRIQSLHWADAKTLWARALAVTTENYRAHGLYGQLLTADGQNSEAVMHFGEALRIQPANAQLQVAEIHTLLGGALDDLDQHEEAIANYRDALRLRPNFPPAHNGLANTLASKGLLQEAITHYQLALQIKPNYAIALNGLGSALDDLGRVDEAMDHYRRALELNPRYAAAHNNLAAAYARQGQIDAAVNEMRAALQYDSQNADYHYNYAVLVSQQGDLAQARQHLETALTLNPQFQHARQALASLPGGSLEEGENP
jgi:tetratricopeptide (TPR) repeat protein